MAPKPQLARPVPEPGRQLWRCLGCGRAGAVECAADDPESVRLTLVQWDHQRDAPKCKRPDIRFVYDMAADYPIRSGRDE